MLKNAIYLAATATFAAALLAQAPPAKKGAPPAPPMGAPKGPPASPAATESKAFAGKTITIKYSSPRVKGREGKIFGPGGLISNDVTYPAWRAGANEATALHTDADLTIGTLNVPKGDYTLFIDIKDPNQWNLIVNRETGQWGLEYHQDQDLGRTKMTMSKPPKMVEDLKYTITSLSANRGRLTLEWEDHIASVDFTVK